MSRGLLILLLLREAMNLMKRSLYRVLLSLVVMLLFVSYAFAAELTGSIWTNSPKSVLGVVYGYYCTAAQNRSSNGTNQYAFARSKKHGKIIASDRQYGNKRAVANSKLNKPTSGYGEYGEDHGSAKQSFGPGAYKGY